MTGRKVEGKGRKEERKRKMGGDCPLSEILNTPLSFTATTATTIVNVFVLVISFQIGVQSIVISLYVCLSLASMSQNKMFKFNHNFDVCCLSAVLLYYLLF